MRLIFCLFQSSLLKIQEQLQLLQQQYDDSVAQLEELKQKKELTIIRLQRASVLTAALAEEQVLWGRGVGKVGLFPSLFHFL